MFAVISYFRFLNANMKTMNAIEVRMTSMDQMLAVTDNHRGTKSSLVLGVPSDGTPPTQRISSPPTNSRDGRSAVILITATCTLHSSTVLY